MKKYLFDNEILSRRSTTNPTTKEVHDIQLRFRPIDEKMQTDIGSLTIKTGADEITWGYGLNTKRFPTYGGEVVQILSTYADQMTIKGTCRNYKELTEIYEYFKSYIFYTTGIQDRERKQKYLLFEYPARNWKFVIMVADASGFRISRDVAAPEWQIKAEIVSENARYSLGSERIDSFANVLATPVATGKRGRSARSAGPPTGLLATRSGDIATEDAAAEAKLPKNFVVDRAGSPFRTFIETTNAERGKIADNFNALVAAWATGDISTVFSNPIAEPEKREMEIWESRFGEGALLVGTGGAGVGEGAVVGGGGPVGEGGIVWGPKQRMFGTVYGDAQNIDDNGLGAGGKILKDYPDSYAELATNEINYANQGQSSKNSYDAMGGLEFETPARVTNPKNGKSMILYKRDVGFGGNGPDGKRGTEDDPKIDIWWMAAKELGFDGWGWLEVEIGTPGAVGGGVAAPNPSDLAKYRPIEGDYNLSGASSQFNQPDGDEGADAPNGGNVHAAFDFFAPAGKGVFAPDDGVIYALSKNSATSGQVYGDAIKVELKNGYVWVFRHTRATVQQGQTVKAGQRIGSVSPWTGATHVHIEIWKNRDANYQQINMIDPLPILKQLYK
jgi:murein DD-endopeptidase MepM/ murein hydrolase activator NlpD